MTTVGYIKDEKLFGMSCCEEKSFRKRSLPKKRQRAEEIRRIVNTELNKD